MTSEPLTLDLNEEGFRSQNKLAWILYAIHRWAECKTGSLELIGKFLNPTSLTGYLRQVLNPFPFRPSEHLPHRNTCSFC